MAAITDPLTLRCGATLPNRLAKAAMTEGLADAEDRATGRHETLYRRWSEGGAGLLITGNVMVDRRYLERPGNVVIDGNGGENALRAWAKAGTAGGNHLWMQISHPGRQCSRTVTRQPLAPSPVQLDLIGLFGRPRAMTAEEIEDVIRRFAHVAAVARETGFTGVQVHGAHGYLLSQFLSPVTNQRDDEWGGPLENRARLLLACVRAVRKAVGDDFPVAVKLNSTDFQKGGFSLEDCVQVAGWLKEAGIDLLEISGGTYEQPKLLGHSGDAGTFAEPGRESTRRREAYFADYARTIQAGYGGRLMVTGGFRSRAAMDEALASGAIDVIGLGRPLCVEADAPDALLSARADRLPSWEDGLRLAGPGWLGPASPVKMLKALNVFGQMGWFYQQLIALSEGRDADRELSTGQALIRHFRTELGVARRRTFKDV
jgi:2,4-dienoyl-CoA reductase-like NADH-dependent reductase (Old Yellow Enzyme family)